MPRRLTFPAAGAALVLTGLGIWAARAIASISSRRRRRSLSAGTLASQANAQGEWRELPKLPRNDDVGLLAQAFSLMTARLKESLDDLRWSEAKLEEAQRVAHVGYWERDLDTDRITWSDETYRIFGLRPGEGTITLPGMLERVHPEDRPILIGALAEALRGVSRYELEYRVVRPGGEVRIVHSQGDLTRDASGRPRSMFGTIQDITERKRAEESLRDSEEQWKAVFENNPTMYFMVDAGGTVLSVNPFGAEQLGYTVDELTGDSVLKVFHEADREAAQLNTRKCVEQLGRAMSWELRKIRKDGSMLWVREAAKAMLIKSRPVILIVCEDITERKRAEYLTGQIFESSPDGISLVGTDYRYRRVNPVYERIWQMPAERIVGKHVAELLGTRDFEQKIKPNLDRCFAGEEVSYATWFTHPRGPRYLAITYSPLRPDSEQVEAALVITHDLTDHMLASEALRETQMELAHANRAATMGQITASIAHEVNQPIAATVTNAQGALRWLGAEPPDLEQARQALARIVDDAKRAGEVVGRIRALIKKEAPRKDRLDINEAIREVVALTRGEAVKNDVSIATQLAEGLPLIHADRVQLQQVVLNLVINAIEAMSDTEGPRDLLITTETTASGGVLVAVKDSGPGLASADLKRAFDPFYTTKPSGLGMGLSICRSIIEALGGRLWATANLPRGAIFQFTVPASSQSGS
jgi:PAS domain S-box-containing protein